MIDIQIEKINFSIPGSWEEVTVKQFDALVRHASDLSPARVVSILTDLGYDAVNNFDCTGFIENVLPVLSWIRQPLDISKLPRKKKITIARTELSVIESPGTERIGQKLYMTQLLEKAETSAESVASIMPGVIANYYAPHMREDKLWKEDHVKEIEKQVWQMKITEAAPECNFFLLGYIRSSREKVKPTMSKRKESKLKPA